MTNTEFQLQRDKFCQKLYKDYLVLKHIETLKRINFIGINLE